MKHLFYLAIVIGILYFMFSKPTAPAPERAAERPPETIAKAPDPTPEHLAAKAREKTATKIRLSVRAYLRSTLKDYDSLKDLQFTDLQTNKDGSPMLQFSFRAKNSFGAYGLEAMEAVLNTNSNTVLVGEIK